MSTTSQRKNMPSSLQVKDVAFPPLGTTTTKKQEKEIIRNNQTTLTTKSDSPTQEHNKNKFNFTVPCKWVIQGTDTSKGIFGTCTKGVGECFYAHSLESLRGPPCNFDNTCHFKNTNCRFIHPDETTEDWLTRTKTPRPNLPKTDIQSRKPHNKPLAVVVTKTVRFPQPTPKPTPQSTPPPTPPSTPPQSTPQSTPKPTHQPTHQPTLQPTLQSTPPTPDTDGKKISSDGKLLGNGRWGYLYVPLNRYEEHVQYDCESQTKVPDEVVVGVPVVHRPMPGMRPLIPELEVGNEPSNTLLKDPHLANLYGCPEIVDEINLSGLTLQESNPYMSMFSKPQEQTEPALPFIKVPTKELAEIAIKEAFRLGILNLQIICEE